MFKKDLTAGQRSKLKSSVQRNIRTKIADTYPALAPHIDSIVPKKEQLDVMKLPDRTSLYALNGKPLFWQHMDDALVPHLKLVHAYPDLFPRLRVDRGAIRFVLGGAALMAPGFTSAGGRLPAEEKKDGERWGAQSEMEKGTVVAVEAEGKDTACAVGTLVMGTKEIKEKKKGVAIDGIHFLGDGLWRMSLD
ncbi:MAG: translation machinery-associated protein 20 [Alyxoria varia]|nr:MAG: translation machinery-associated protein 20 [Alyxoria varia]